MVIAVTTGGLALFVRAGSKVGLPIDTRFVTTPLNVEMTFKVRLVIVLVAKSPTFVQMTWLTALVVATGKELTKTNPTGRLSVTEIAVAVDGPRLVTEIV